MEFTSDRSELRNIRGLMKQECLMESQWETTDISLNVELTSYTAPQKSSRQKLVSELHGSYQPRQRTS